jgi:hypothetical protein
MIPLTSFAPAKREPIEVVQRQAGLRETPLVGTFRQECRLTRRIDGRETSLELRVLATPLICDNERFTLLAVANISR